MNIGEAAIGTGLTAKTIRYYERIGLLPRPARAANGYRHHGLAEPRQLGSGRRARRPGFSMDQSRALLDLYGDRNRRSADVKRLAMARIGEIERRIAELKTLKRSLQDLSGRCHGDERPDCPILDDLTGPSGARH